MKDRVKGDGRAGGGDRDAGAVRGSDWGGGSFIHEEVCGGRGMRILQRQDGKS